MAKKSSKSRKTKAPARKRKTTKPAASRGRARAGADRSRIDLRPLKDHIRQRIQDLKKGGPEALAGPAGMSPEDTVDRLERVLQTLAEICHPTMDVPI